MEGLFMAQKSVLVTHTIALRIEKALHVIFKTVHLTYNCRIIFLTPTTVIELPSTFYFIIKVRTPIQFKMVMYTWNIVNTVSCCDDPIQCCIETSFTIPKRREKRNVNDFLNKILIPFSSGAHKFCSFQCW